MNRKDFRPNSSFPQSMSSKDRQTIQSRKKIGNRDDVVKGFLNHQNVRTSNDSLSTDGRTLKSYNTVIATRQSDDSVLVNQTKYSSTTSQQQSKLMRELKSSGTPYSVTGGLDRGYEGEDLENDDKHTTFTKEEKESLKRFANRK